MFYRTTTDQVVPQMRVVLDWGGISGGSCRRSSSGLRPPASNRIMSMPAANMRTRRAESSGRSGEDPARQRDGLRSSDAYPFHIHGAGRFLILSRDGAVEPNLVWKDTVLIPTGQTVDILLDVTNPGVWVAHCHIAEHHEGGMLFNFHVEP
jgi:hypothetical protein